MRITPSRRLKIATQRCWNACAWSLMRRVNASPKDRLEAAVSRASVSSSTVVDFGEGTYLRARFAGVDLPRPAGLEDDTFDPASVRFVIAVEFLARLDVGVLSDVLLVLGDEGQDHFEHPPVVHLVGEQVVPLAGSLPRSKIIGNCGVTIGFSCPRCSEAIS